MIGSGRGGGGGFGGFPYRSAHQQGQDGRGNNRQRGRGRGGRNGGRNRQPRGRNSQSLQAQLDIPPDQRRILVGRGGNTLNWLKEVSGANIFVPQQNNRHQQHPVRVNSSDLSSLIHAFYEIANLLSLSSDFDSEFVGCIVRMIGAVNSNDATFDGRLLVPSSNGTVSAKRHCLFLGTAHSVQQTEISDDCSESRFHVYSIETTNNFDQENISTIVDNIRFVDSSVAKCQWYCKEAPFRGTGAAERRLVFVFGPDETNPNLLFEAVCKVIDEAKGNATTS